MQKPFTIYVLQQAHTDIGFTHPQEQIMAMYLEHYDKVLELCKASVHLPKNEQFKWTCETSWQVKNYVTNRPEREAEFLEYVRSGQIEITASYLHFADVIDTDAYRRSLEWVATYCRKNNLPLRAAMHSDINGWAWSLPDIFQEYGIEFFCSQVHIDSATDPLGVNGSVHYQWLLEWPQLFRKAPPVPIRVPHPLWWNGPKGGQVLHWFGEHYMLGNVLGISSPRDFGASKSHYFYEDDKFTAEELYARAKVEVPRYLERLQEAGYGLDAIMLNTGGYYVDNAPPNDRWCKVIALWNNEHSDVRLRTATLSEWFDYLATQENKNQWKHYQVAWPDAWAHGLGTATARITQARTSQRRRSSVEWLVKNSALPIAQQNFEMALEQERLSLEHTFGAWSMANVPALSSNEFLKEAKDLYFHRTEMYLDEAAEQALRHLLPRNQNPHLYSYFNTNATTLHFNVKNFSVDATSQELQAENEQRFAFQIDSEDLGNFVAVVTTPEKGLVGLELADSPSRKTVNVVTQPAINTLENEFWQLQLEPKTGTLLNLSPKDSNFNWVNPNSNSGYGFGQVVHEAIVHPMGRKAVNNEGRFVGLCIASQQLKEQLGDKKVFEHSLLNFEVAPQLQSGPVFDSIKTHGQSERLGNIKVEWRLYKDLPIAELILDWYKTWSDLPEAVYVAFPFTPEAQRLSLETAGGFFEPGSHDNGGQLAGTVSNYYTVQRAAKIEAANNAKLFWSPVDAPLVMTRAINFCDWEREPFKWNGFLASMPVNHYWHTNFPTSQRGFIRLRYRFVNPASFANEETAIQQILPVEALGWR